MPRMSRRGFVESLGAVGAAVERGPRRRGRGPRTWHRTARCGCRAMASACRRGPTRRFWQSWPRAPRSKRIRTFSAARSSGSSSQWATLLGKETAVFMPSGTLANHLALRALAGARRRVIVPETSHIYNDTGDACQTLSGLTLLPLAPGAATFTRADIEAVLARTASGRVATDVGAIAIESPVRRLSGQMFDWAELAGVAALARERGIGLHLDGARLFIASAYTGRSPADFAAPFDTVYVSLWKYFNCGQGAILAGPRRVLEGMFHTRRMFGGNLAVGWPAALVARHYMDGFVERSAGGGRGVRGVLSRHRRAPAGGGRADPQRHQPHPAHAEGGRSGAGGPPPGRARRADAGAGSVGGGDAGRQRNVDAQIGARARRCLRARARMRDGIS